MPVRAFVDTVGRPFWPVVDLVHVAIAKYSGVKYDRETRTYRVSSPASAYERGKIATKTGIVPVLLFVAVSVAFLQASSPIMSAVGILVSTSLFFASISLISEIDVKHDRTEESGSLGG